VKEEMRWIIEGMMAPSWKQDEAKVSKLVVTL
jgi:hypothetical protein